MATLIAEHRVEDYARWRPVYEEHEEVRQKFRIANSRVYTDPADPNMVAVIMEGSTEDLEAFTAAPELKEAMQDAGVAGPPKFTFMAD